MPPEASVTDPLLAFTQGASPYQLASEDVSPHIYVDADDFKGVQRTAQDLANDFGRVVGNNGTLSLIGSPDTVQWSDGPVIIAGSIGHSSLIDSLVSKNKIDVDKVEGLWEAYTSVVVEAPFSGVPWALVIAGSDQRGVSYGLYDISEQMGVSPWYWWADVPVKTKSEIWVRKGPKVQGSPSVKYRGFFINDEAPSLTGWADGKFTKSEYGSSFTGEFYKLVFELCLRLKGNYIWPAMWSSMFYVDDANNGDIADDFGVFMGTSHHEPMARAGNEQGEFMAGPWDWSRNRDNITQFFEEGVERSKNWDTIYTLGMRGDGDAESPTLTADALEDIIQVQQSILKEELGLDNAGDVPQTWVLYKEVGKYYQAGMKTPDDVILLWTDDNSGNIQRLPLANETDRSGGAGIYYHFDYVGAPRNYKWINTIQLVKTWEQMHLAYEKQARELWIANVGDIKPLEIPLTHFMDMAYDMSKYTSPKGTSEWLHRWATREFGADVASQTAEILTTYGTMLIRRKYELLSDQPYAFSTANYDEVEKIMSDWEDLLELTESTYDSLDEATKVAYYQLIMHPVEAGKTVVDLYNKNALNAWYAQQGRTSTNAMANDVQALFAQDQVITEKYHTLNGGKWNHFVDQVHIGYTYWQDPSVNAMPNMTYLGESNATDDWIMGVSIQGSSASAPGDSLPSLLPVDPYMPSTEKRYLDIFTRNNGTFSYHISSNVSYVSVTNDEGTLEAPGSKSDIRSVISVDWEEAPPGLSWVALRVKRTDICKGPAVVALLPVNKTSVPDEFEGYVESGGVVSWEAEHYSSAEEKNGLSYVTIPDYGRTLSGLKLWPVTHPGRTPEDAPKLTYSFYSFTDRPEAQLVVYLGGSLNHDPSLPLKYAYALDGGSPVEVQPIPDEAMGSLPPGWNDATVAGGWTSYSTLKVPAGAHELSLWLLEPGVVVQKVVMDLGGLKSSALGPPESQKV
ncbi:uncharacterized protein F5Z01DRAFT_734377 [Emericellopsis atlantica]|uniref:Gylcosyl hydrolase 115 C-terminal domain-containing protein n=1 Tax=Emericellopsis atlantica TaxID=2614577 RepID=A0A9P7ZT24_9HYPO|nr:uncharacterized protein F5Z01DRAFT_734377 [Emericellopsis atlantica]KAG9257165.1 hypothetical protein F5Z01DRAFT_734377 [Emericellopsis atlantica]